MQKIVPSLWFDNQRAEEALGRYASLFRDGEVVDALRFGDIGPWEPGSVVAVTARLAGTEIIGINGGPEFAFTPAISFTVGCESVEELDALWAGLVEGGGVLMELGSYPFSERYGWLADRYGVSWQLMLTGQPQSITPSLLFVGDQNGRAAAAMKRYTALFDNAGIGNIARYGAEAGDQAGQVMHATFELAGQPFTAMDGGPVEHKFNFTEAVSFLIKCDDQAEIDHFWEQLGDGGEYSQCGWLNDRFGVTWQITPARLFDLERDPDREKANRAISAMLEMTKLDLAALEAAFAGEGAPSAR